MPEPGAHTRAPPASVPQRLGFAESRMNATDLASALSNSLSLGSILILTALGLAITFGVMRVINMAHGEMLMLGAYTTLVVTDPHYLGLSFFWAVPIAFVVVGF